MTNKELIKWLSQFPMDLNVMVDSRTGNKEIDNIEVADLGDGGEEQKVLFIVIDET